MEFISGGEDSGEIEENHMAKVGFYWRYGHNMEEFWSKNCAQTFSKRTVKLWKFFQPIGTVMYQCT